MTRLAAASAMTTPIAVEYLDAERAAATSAQQFNGAILLENEWQTRVVRRILELERLTADWDGYGSPPIGRETVSRTIWLLSRITDLGVETLPAPFVGPVAGGGIILEWTLGSRELSIAVLPEGKIEYLKWEAGEQFEEDELSLSTPVRLRELISWLTRRV